MEIYVRYSSSDLSRKSGDIIAHALQAPVIITQRSKPRLVILSIDEYRRLKEGQKSTRKAHRIENVPDALFDEFEKGVKQYAQDNIDE